MVSLPDEPKMVIDSGKGDQLVKVQPAAEKLGHRPVGIFHADRNRVGIGIAYDVDGVGDQARQELEGLEGRGGKSGGREDDLIDVGERFAAIDMALSYG